MSELDDKKQESGQDQNIDSQSNIPAEGQRKPAADPKAGLNLSGAEDAALDQEIEAALEGVDLLDMYGMEEPAEAKVSTPTSQSSAPGVNKGKVISVSDEGLFVDLGGKSQGFLPTEECEEGKRYEMGDTVQVSIIRYDQRDGLLVLSTKAAEQQLVRSNLKEGAYVEARVTGSNKGGLEMDIKGIKAFMPASQIDFIRIENLDTLIGQRYVCEVTQVEHGDRNVVLSRRNVLLKEELEQREKVWAELEVGQLRHGVVRSLMDYGAFVNLGGVDGLLHVREISWARIKDPKEILAVGQGIDVVVIGIDREKRRISLSLRQAGGDPWTAVEQKYAVGSTYQAQIVKLMDFGAFAQLEPGVEGLIPISEMTWAGRIRHPSDVVQPGMIVEVKILRLDVKEKRISLSMKSLQANPWLNIEEKYRPNEIYPGKVARITDFGAFVTLEDGVDGLVHISELSEKRVGKVSDVVQNGQEIQVKVLKVDAAEQRISLSLKGMGGEPEEPKAAAASEPAAQPAVETKPGKKKQRPLRGGLSW